MRRATAALLGLTLLAGCGQKTPDAPVGPIDSAQLNAIASSGPTIAEVLAQGNDATPARPKPEAFAYAGTWATNPALCRRNAWHFGTRSVEVGDESHCAIDRSEARTASEVKLSVTCQPAGGGIQTQERWSLVHAADGRMIVARSAGNGIPRSVTLGACPG